MSRDIRFRAWNIKEKRWSNDDDGYWGDGDCFTPVENVNINLGNKEFIFEQYIGLKDKNGKEIYEGDIIKYDRGYCHEVVFIKDRFGIPTLGCSEAITIYRGGEKDFKVVGNIHENPELLKGGEE